MPSKILLVGEPMGLFIAKSEGPLDSVGEMCIRDSLYAPAGGRFVQRKRTAVFLQQGRARLALGARARVQAFFHGLCQLSAQRLVPEGDAHKRRLVPVSYTHLDVYKRQGF